MILFLKKNFFKMYPRIFQKVGQHQKMFFRDFCQFWEKTGGFKQCAGHGLAVLHPSLNLRRVPPHFELLDVTTCGEKLASCPYTRGQTLRCFATQKGVTLFFTFFFQKCKSQNAPPRVLEKVSFSIFPKFVHRFINPRVFFPFRLRGGCIKRSI